LQAFQILLSCEDQIRKCDMSETEARLNRLSYMGGTEYWRGHEHLKMLSLRMKIK
jgi:hypothetical protein